MLTVIGNDIDSRSGNKNSRRLICQCDCGNVLTIAHSSLITSNTKSCGCSRKELIRKANTKHGQASYYKKTPEYAVWDGMIQRCTNEKHLNYHHYGGRGIIVCQRWLNSFENFLADMGQRPSKSYSLDRYPNNNGNYELSNCRWATKKEQANNTRSNVWFEINGIRMNQSDWCKYFGVKDCTLIDHFKKGKTFTELYNFYQLKNSNKNAHR